MSGKIKAKDLSYDTTLPPFLQRLRDQHTGRNDDDRHERAIIRPKKAKNLDDEDDAPTVVDESGDILSRNDFQKLADDAKASGPDTELKTSDKTPLAQPTVHHDRVLVHGTAQKKRKVAKVVGNDESDTNPVAEDNSEQRAFKKPKKKAKAIKLTFGDDDT